MRPWGPGALAAVRGVLRQALSLPHPPVCGAGSQALLPTCAPRGGWCAAGCLLVGDHPPLRRASGDRRSPAPADCPSRRPQRVVSRAGVARGGVGHREGRPGWGAHPIPAARPGSRGGDLSLLRGASGVRRSPSPAACPWSEQPVRPRRGRRGRGSPATVSQLSCAVAVAGGRPLEGRLMWSWGGGPEVGRSASPGCPCPGRVVGGLLSTCCGRRCARVGTHRCPLGACALRGVARHGGGLRSPRRGTSHRSEGRLASGTLPVRVPLPLYPGRG